MRGQGKSRLKLDPSHFNLELFFVWSTSTQKYVDTYCLCLSNYITPNRLWSAAEEEESSNFKELKNLVDMVDEEAKAGRLQN